MASQGYKQRVKVTKTQIEIIVSYFENNPDFHKGSLTEKFTAENWQKHWNVLTSKLNSSGGAIKAMDKWSKVSLNHILLLFFLITFSFVIK